MNQDIFNEIAAKQEASADKMAAKCETTVPFHPVILVIFGKIARQVCDNITRHFLNETVAKW